MTNEAQMIEFIRRLVMSREDRHIDNIAVSPEDFSAIADYANRLSKWGEAHSVVPSSLTIAAIPCVVLDIVPTGKLMITLKDIGKD